METCLDDLYVPSSESKFSESMRIIGAGCIARENLIELIESRFRMELDYSFYQSYAR